LPGIFELLGDLGRVAGYLWVAG